ncbi:MAG: hypothetical protein KME10_19055 [Plectolyngbya sp. WJT66-NPBG17]|jgi:hypothetical protein|nr:hypothetical protein [Plectolyngbya sp. WJT66-NPBG17]
MSSLEQNFDPPFTQSEIRLMIAKFTHQEISDRTFRRWRKAAMIPAGRRGYTRKEAEKLLFIARKMLYVGSLAEAHKQLKEWLNQTPNQRNPNMNAQSGSPENLGLTPEEIELANQYEQGLKPKPVRPSAVPKSDTTGHDRTPTDTATLSTIDQVVGTAGIDILRAYDSKEQAAIAVVCDALTQRIESFPYRLAVAVVETLDSTPIAPVFEFEEYDEAKYRRELQKLFGVVEDPRDKFNRLMASKTQSQRLLQS